jgi:uncharacterized protein
LKDDFYKSRHKSVAKMLALTVQISINGALYNQRAGTFAHLTMVKYCKCLKNMEMVIKYGKAGFLKYPSFSANNYKRIQSSLPVYYCEFFIYFAPQTTGAEKDKL